jgi:hypothetical protein
MGINSAPYSKPMERALRCKANKTHKVWLQEWITPYMVMVWSCRHPSLCSRWLFTPQAAAASGVASHEKQCTTAAPYIVAR